VLSIVLHCNFDTLYYGPINWHPVLNVEWYTGLTVTISQYKLSHSNFTATWVICNTGVQFTQSHLPLYKPWTFSIQQLLPATLSQSPYCRSFLNTQLWNTDMTCDLPPQLKLTSKSLYNGNILQQPYQIND